MKRRILRGLLVANVLLWSIALILITRWQARNDPSLLPTLAVLPSLTPTSTWTPSTTMTASLTATPTPTSTIPTPTRTATLATRVLSLSAIMPGVSLPPTLTPFPEGLYIIPAPPEPYEPLRDATYEPPPYRGWYSFESDHPLVAYAPVYWTPIQIHAASRGQYHRTEDLNGTVSFPFEGEGLRVRYVAARNMGRFDLIVDGVILDTIDAYATELSFPGTQVYTLRPGAHVLQLRSAGKNPASENYVIGLDAIQVYLPDANTLILPPHSLHVTPTEAPIPAERVERVAAPPTVQPTATPLAPSLITVALVIAYDENGNNAVDPAEGVSGISVRAVEVGTNRVITGAVTDARGYTELQLLTATDIRVVVPYFGEFWDVPRRSGAASFTLLLDAANQPGLIP